MPGLVCSEMYNSLRRKKKRHVIQFVYYSEKLCNHFVKAFLERFGLVGRHVVEDGESVKCSCCVSR